MATSDRWARVEALYHAARERSASERAAFLDAACGNDAELRREIESLLAQPVSNDDCEHQDHAGRHGEGPRLRTRET